MAKQSVSPSSKYSEDFKQEVVAYYSKHGPTAAHKHFKIPLSTVADWARKRKAKTTVTVDNRAATEANMENMRNRRSQIAADLLEDAVRLRDQIWKPHEYHDWGGKDHEFDVREVDQIPPADKLKLMQATSTALDQVAKLTADTDSTKSDAESMLEKLAKMAGNVDG